MMKQTCFLFLMLVFSFIHPDAANAQEYFWIGFTDKNNTPFSLTNPSDYLSERAIQRRDRQQIAIDSLDLPVNKGYIKGITDLGVELVHASKWLNGVTVKATGIDSFAYKAGRLSFVKEVQLTKKSGTKSAFIKFEETAVTENVPIDASFFGPSVHQTSIMNAQYLFNQGFKGKGIRIAVIDAGFLNADKYFSFDTLWAKSRILGTRDFVNPAGNIFEASWHGMGVLSVMGGNVPGQLLGTAIEADYWLLRSEDAVTETLIEEDNWVVAAEFADSTGCDVINSSLGYTTFDNPEMNHTYADLDGKTTRITRGANVAASRGMLVFNSAGNEGNKTWKYLSAPSDGDLVIGVGAVGKDSVAASFTSYGPASDGDIKPDVSGMGVGDYMQTGESLGYANGTSFSSPVVAGATASLWSAFPEATANQVKQAIIESAHLKSAPSVRLGNGIPDFKKAFIFLKNLSVPEFAAGKKWNVYPNPVGEILILQKNENVSEKTDIAMYSIDGKLLMQKTVTGESRIVLGRMNQLPSGIFILRISSDGEFESVKLSKIE